MAGSSNITTEHDMIKKWAEERNGKPASVIGTGEGEDAGILRIDFPGRRGQETLEEITWEEFFNTFEEKNLAFLFQEKTSDGKISRFNKIISRDLAMTENNKEEYMEEESDWSDENMDEYSSLFMKEMDELKQIAEEKHIPHPEEFNKEELVMAIELVDLSEK